MFVCLPEQGVQKDFWGMFCQGVQKDFLEVLVKCQWNILCLPGTVEQGVWKGFWGVLSQGVQKEFWEVLFKCERNIGILQDVC